MIGMLVAWSGYVQGKTAYQTYIASKGYGAQTTLLTEKDTMILTRPSCAYVNIDGILALPQAKGVDSCGWLEWYDPTNDVYFKKRVILNAQGNSSLLFQKKNISIDLCEDEWEADQTTLVKIGDWVGQDSYHLKAYYIDWLRGIGTIGYWIFDDIVAEHNSYLERAGVEDYEQGARCYPDGFPCIVYHNGGFYGIYAWQLKKDRTNMGMKKSTVTHIHLDGTLRPSTLWDGKIDWTQFEVRNPKKLYCVTLTKKGKYAKYDGDNPTELIDETMPLYDPTDEDHVRTAQVKHTIEKLSHYCGELDEMQRQGATETEIKQALEERLDVVGAIDYAAFSMVINNIDGLGGKNWQWFTYDGRKWFVTPYDLDATFGNLYNGQVLFPAYWSYTTQTYEQLCGTALFKWIRSLYIEDIKARYRQWRSDYVIHSEAINTYLDEWYNAVGEENYALEYAHWSKSYCIRPTICNTGWTTKDDWTNYAQLPTYDATHTYHKGDQCTLDFRIWTATQTQTGVFPYKQIGYTDSLQRYKDWMKERIRLLDGWAGYEDPTAYINNIKPDKKEVVNKYFKDGTVYIRRNGKDYDVFGMEKK